MGKIKGWEKVQISHQPHPKNVNWIEAIWRNNASEIIISKGNRYEYVKKFRGVTQYYANSDTKKEIFDYAMKHMRSHPNG